jgi:hypothetical protein
MPIQYPMGWLDDDTILCLSRTSREGTRGGLRATIPHAAVRVLSSRGWRGEPLSITIEEQTFTATPRRNGHSIVFAIPKQIRHGRLEARVPVSFSVSLTKEGCPRRP